MQHEVLERLAIAGFQARVVPLERLPQLHNELNRLLAGGFISDGIGGMLDGFFDESEVMPGARSVFIAASPTPIGRAAFHHNGVKVAAQIPPTYLDYTRAPEQILGILNEALAGGGYRAAVLRKVPRKMLAAHSGLAEYGRNNVCYVKRMGSFALLSCFCSDMPCEEDNWRAARRMTSCERCRACSNNCPTRAIRPDCNLIDAGRCLTLYNETDSSEPFPDWLDLRAHNALIGCMRCQAACPANRAYLGMLTDEVEFDEAETRALLDGVPFDELPEAAREKARVLAMDTYYEPIARNLRALLEKPS